LADVPIFACTSAISCEEKAVGYIFDLPVYPCNLLAVADCSVDDFGAPCYSKRGWLLPSTLKLFLRLLQVKWKISIAPSPTSVMLWANPIIFGSHMSSDRFFEEAVNDFGSCIYSQYNSLRLGDLPPDPQAVVFVLLCMIVHDDSPIVLCCFTVGSGEVVLCVLDSSGNLHGKKVIAFRDTLQKYFQSKCPSSSLGATVTLMPALNKNKTYQCESLKHCGFVSIDILDTILGSTTAPYIQSGFLLKEKIPSHIYHCFEQKMQDDKPVSYKWTTIAQRKASRNELGAYMFNNLKWSDFDEKLAVVVRRHLKINRPLGDRSDSVFVALQKRHLSKNYAAVPLNKIMLFRKGRVVDGKPVSPAGYVLDKKKLVNLLSDTLGTDHYRIAVWYNDDYGFLCPKFHDYVKHKKDVMQEIGIEAADSDAAASSADEEAAEVRARKHKRRKVEPKQGLKVYVSYDEGFKDDQVCFYNLFAEDYGTMAMLSKTTTPLSTSEISFLQGSWVLLEQINPTAELLVCHGKEEDTLFTERLRPSGSPSESAVCYDGINQLWRECVIKAVDFNMVPPAAKVQLNDTGIILELPFSKIRASV
jgi:hypothetical protein